MLVLVLNLFSELSSFQRFFNSFLDFSVNDNWITLVKPFK